LATEELLGGNAGRHFCCWEELNLWKFEQLEFESGIFGAPVGRVVSGDKNLFEMSQDWTSQGVWLVSARVDKGDIEADEDLIKANFLPIEALVTLERALPKFQVMPNGVRVAIDGDIKKSLLIARTAFKYDRFHADARVPNDAADRLKEKWVAKGFSGRSDAVLVVEIGGSVVGFSTCMVNGDTAIIDLIAISPDHQGMGIGKSLVQGVIATYAGRCRVIRVGTQDTNLHSLKLYHSCGFMQVTSQVSYHWVNALKASKELS